MWWEGKVRWVGADVPGRELVYFFRFSQPKVEWLDCVKQHTKGFKILDDKGREQGVTGDAS